MNIAALAQKIKGIFGATPSGFEPFIQDTGTEVIGKVVVPLTRCLPLRALPDGRTPHVTSGHFLRNPERKNHFGCDFFYAWKAGDAAMRIGDGGRTAKWFIPDRTWAIAPADGLITIAGNSRTGHRVWIQHAGGLLTGGFHMTEIAVRAGDAVKMGDDIGIVGDNPIDNDARHLHWECYLGDIGKYPKGTLDPEASWLVNAKCLPARPSAP